MPTFSDRGVGVREASVLVVYVAFTSQLSIFCMVHTLLQSQNHTRVSKGRPFLCYVHKQDICILYSGCFRVICCVLFYDIH